jgi:hypothetical protein
MYKNIMPLWYIHCLRIVLHLPCVIDDFIIPPSIMAGSEKALGENMFEIN